MAEISKPNEAVQNALLITRTLNLPLATTWRAWTESESLKKWWGPREFTCPECSVDFRVGGKYLSCMKAPDGKEYWSTGVYKEIVPQQKIVMTDSFSDSKGNIIPASELNMPGNWPMELMVTVQMEDAGGQTRLTVQQVGVPEQMHKECMEGWQQSLDKMETNLR